MTNIALKFGQVVGQLKSASRAESFSSDLSQQLPLVDAILPTALWTRQFKSLGITRIEALRQCFSLQGKLNLIDHDRRDKVAAGDYVQFGPSWKLRLENKRPNGYREERFDQMALTAEGIGIFRFRYRLTSTGVIEPMEPKFLGKPKFSDVFRLLCSACGHSVTGSFSRFFDQQMNDLDRLFFYNPGPRMLNVIAEARRKVSTS